MSEEALRRALKLCLAALTDERLGSWRYMEGSDIYAEFRLAADTACAVLSEGQAPEPREMEVLRYERDHAQAHLDSATRLLASIHAYLNPRLMKVGDKTMRFVNPLANEALQGLSDAVRAIEEAGYAPTQQAPEPVAQETLYSRNPAPNAAATPSLGGRTFTIGGDKSAGMDAARAKAIVAWVWPDGSLRWEGRRQHEFAGQKFALYAAPEADRYRWLRENLYLFIEDEAGVPGVAFSYQIPLDDIKRLSEPELVDAIVDRALATEGAGS